MNTHPNNHANAFDDLLEDDLDGLHKSPQQVDKNKIREIMNNKKNSNAPLKEQDMNQMNTQKPSVNNSKNYY